MKCSLIFPHQLFEESPLFQRDHDIFLVEESLYFNQYKFHKQKICWQRASMKYYESFLISKGFKVHYIEAKSQKSEVRNLLEGLQKSGFQEVHYMETVDNWLEKRINKKAKELGIQCFVYQSPMFLNSSEELYNYFKDRKRFFQTDFYVDQRKRRKILLDKGKAVGGKWTFDAENREKYPKNKAVPIIQFPEKDNLYNEAFVYTEEHFKDYYGQLEANPAYPHTHETAKKWLEQFLEIRFWEFGHYEDAMLKNEIFLHHSILSPLLNSGLLTPDYVLNRTLEFYEKNPDLPLNSLEGFIRQIMGWREFIRAVYELKGTEERNKNFWKFKRKIPESFWEGKTGIDPVDRVIKKVLKTGYCHHIERLMILGNIMLLCEFDPDEVYRWFMELFIDAYDWVMVPNVYGMSQFADGGIMATKPYISGSNYIMKMSDFDKGDWQGIWDALFWRFIHNHRDYFISQPRLSMMVYSFDKMATDKKENLLKTAEDFLKTI